MRTRAERQTPSPVPSAHCHNPDYFNKGPLYNNFTNIGATSEGKHWTTTDSLGLRFLLVFDSVSPLQLRTSGPHQATHLTSTFHRHNVETPARCYRSGTARSQLSLTLLYRELVQSAEHPYWALYERIILVYGHATTKALSECYI